MTSLLETLRELLPTGATLVVIVLGLMLLNRVLERRVRTIGGGRFRQQLITLGVTLLGILALVLVLPISDTVRGQLLGLIGILLSAAIALSSTTVLGNAMAGIMMRAVRGFRIGDFVRVEEHFGRVTEQGLFHTEIQTEQRDLTTLPNLYLVSHPVTTVRTSGTVVSTKVSLGYDVPRDDVKRLLLEAAAQCELSDPFVHVNHLGDFSVTYRVAGILTDVKQLLTVRSRLRALVLDTLHAAGIEIVSPTFMNTRALTASQRFVPPVGHEDDEPDAGAEAVVFDKADQAESLLQERERLGAEIATLEQRLAETADKERRQALAEQRDRLVAQLQAAQASIPDEEEGKTEGPGS